MKTIPAAVFAASMRPVVSVCVLVLAAAGAQAQLTPEREYYGINRTIPMTIAMPTGVAGEVEVALYQPDGEEVAKASASEGSVDLAGLFPVLWTATTPMTVYAQLLVDDEPIGSAVVLIPMVSPNMATRGARSVVFPERSPQSIVYAGLRAWTDRHVVFTTSLGTIEFRMRPEKAPNTVANFLDLVEGGYYTGIIFHRIISKLPSTGEPFMAQVGDPTGTGSGGPGRFIDLEQSNLPHDFGVLSMARTGDPNTNGGQVFVCFSRKGTEFLDTQYCSFAEAVSGAETILALEAVETGEGDRPLDPPVITSATTVPAPAFGTGPEALKRPEAGER